MSDFETYLKKVGEVGNVVGINSGLVYCSGLSGAKIWEKIIFKNGSIGLVYSISRDKVEVLLLDSRTVDPSMMAARTGETINTNVSAEALGRVVDVFGMPADGKANFKKVEERYLEAAAPPLIDRVRINQNLETGVTLVDTLIPLGKGQRQLIIGDQKTGKTSFLMQVIARQAQLGTICIYASMGRKKSDLAATVVKLSKLGALSKTIVIAAPSSTPSSLIYLTPFAAMSFAEYFKDKGYDVLVVLDEISSHANHYRELSILSKRMPGRDGYPGDIFYTHSHILERAGRFLVSKGDEKKQTLTLKIEGKTAAITCLPVVETLRGDFTGYIQTNLMSMTDGHVFFDIGEFQEGLRPGINAGLSVTRVGRQTQNTIERDFAVRVRDILFKYSKALSVAKFGVELQEATRSDIAQGEKLYAIFDQQGEVLVPRPVQLLFLELLLAGFWANSLPSEIKTHKEKILKAHALGRLRKFNADLVGAIEFGLAKKFSATVAQNVNLITQICRG